MSSATDFLLYAAKPWEALGERLRTFREDLGLTQQHVSWVTGIPRSAISDIEHGTRKVYALELPLFAKALHCSVGRLVGEELSDGEEGMASALAVARLGLTTEDQAAVLRFARFLHAEGQRR